MKNYCMLQDYCVSKIDGRYCVVLLTTRLRDGRQISRHILKRFSKWGDCAIYMLGLYNDLFNTIDSDFEKLEVEMFCGTVYRIYNYYGVI